MLTPLSLRTRLSLLVGFIVALVVGAAAFLELRMFTTRMERELIGGARNTARAVADDFELRSRADDNAIEAEVLHQFLEVNPAVRSITVIEVDGDAARTVLSTSSDERHAAIEVAAARHQRLATKWTRRRARCASSPCRSSGCTGRWAVVVTVSTAAVDRVARDGGLLALS